MGSPSTLPPSSSSLNAIGNPPLDDKNILVAGSRHCGKTSLIFTLARGIFPGDFVPGRFDGWSVAAAATTPKDLLNELHSKSLAKSNPYTKPYFVNLTFWEDRPRLNRWETLLQQRRKLEEEASKEQKQLEIKDIGNGNEESAEDNRPTLQRRSSQVSYATVNGITVPNYTPIVQNVVGKPPTGKKKQQPPVEPVVTEADLASPVLCAPRPYICPEPDILVLCYSSVDFNSLTELETVIWPDLSEKFPDVPVILVATKCDARDVSSANEDDHEEIWQIEEDSSDHSSMKNSPPKTTSLKMGQILAQRINANAYIECSALENRGLRHIVEEAVWILNSAVIASSEANAILANNEPASSSSLNNGSRKWSLSSSYPSSKSANFITKSRKSSHSLSRTTRKISTTSTGSTASSYTTPRPNICVQDPFSTSLPASIVASSGHRKQSYVRKILQNVSPKH